VCLAGVGQIAEFSDKVLPLHFKHRRWTSFVRQLHIYGFKKWAEPGGGDGKVEFRNPQFTRTGRDVLHTIKRRVIPASDADGARPRSKRRRQSVGLTAEQAQMLTVALAKQQEVLQRVERLETANHHLSRVNDFLSMELLSLKQATRKPAGAVAVSAARMCELSRVVLLGQLQMSSNGVAAESPPGPLPAVEPAPTPSLEAPADPTVPCSSV